MSAYVSHSVTLTYSTIGVGTTASVFTSLFSDDESYEIVSLPKKRLDWALLENITGSRQLYSIRVQQITEAQRIFLYSYIQSQHQYVTINGVEHYVFLRDEQLTLDLLDGYIGNVVLTMEFEDRVFTPVAVPSRTQGIASNSVGYGSTGSGSGTIVTMTYNYGGGDTKRTFRVNSVYCYKADILDHRWEYVDRNRGIKRLGYRLNFDIDFGGFGLGQTQAQFQDDRDWIKEFVLAPTKYIEVFGQYVGGVVNDFSDVQYTYIGNIIYNKTTKLNFKQQELQTNTPVPYTSIFILDSGSSGVLDTHRLG